MPSAANAKSEKPASAEAADNSPIRQIMTIIEHKIRNLEKRKSKLTSYRDLQKAGKELKSDQKVAVAKYDEVAQTLEFARDLSKQITSIALSTEREIKKQAKREAWVRYASDTNKIREVLLVLDCLMQMGTNEVREDFLNGTNGAAKLKPEDLKILDDLYPEVTPKHQVNEEGQPGFHIHTAKAAEHLYGIIDGKPKEVFGTTYAHIKEIITSVHSCGYFDKVESPVVETEEVPVPEEVPQPQEAVEEEPQPQPQQVNEVVYQPAGVMPPYAMRPLPPITLQEVEQAYFVQQYPPQPRISDVIGSQNFFFLQDSEIDSPVGTPQPVLPSPPHAIPPQTFTNQQYVPLPPQPCFPPSLPERAPYPQQPLPPAPLPPPPEPERVEPPAESEPRDDWKESRSPEEGERRVQGQGDAQGRYRRYPARARGASNGYRGRGGYQPRNKDYQPRHYNDNYHPRHKDGYQPRNADNYCGNGDAADSHHNENGARERHGDSQSYQGGYKGRGRGGRPPAARAAPRPSRGHYARKHDE